MYHGHVQFVPAPGYETYGEPVRQSVCDSNTKLCKDDQGDRVNVSLCGYQGLAVGADGCEWRYMDGPFISVWINNVPWAGEDVMPAPNAKVVAYMSLKTVIYLCCNQKPHTSHLHNTISFHSFPFSPPFFFSIF